MGFKHDENIRHDKGLRMLKRNFKNDLPFSGCALSFCNNQQGENKMISKIDRVLGNSYWLDLVNNCTVVFLLGIMSGHATALVHLPDQSDCENRPFKF